MRRWIFLGFLLCTVLTGCRGGAPKTERYDPVHHERNVGEIKLGQ